MLVTHTCPPPEPSPPVLATGAAHFVVSSTGEIRMIWDADLTAALMTCPGCHTSFVFTAAGWLPLIEETESDHA